MEAPMSTEEMGWIYEIHWLNIPRSLTTMKTRKEFSIWGYNGSTEPQMLPVSLGKAYGEIFSNMDLVPLHLLHLPIPKKHNILF